MKEIEGKLPEDKQGPIDAALAEFKAAHAAKDVAGCDAAQEKLNGALSSFSRNSSSNAAKPRRWRSRSTDGGGDAGGADDVTDVDFEEVK